MAHNELTKKPPGGQCVQRW